MTVILLLAIIPFLLFRGRTLTTAVARSFWMALLVFAFVNFILYPAILQYQAGTQAGHYITRLIKNGAGQMNVSVIYTLEEAPASYSFEFDCPGPLQRLSMDSLHTHLGKGPVYVFAPSPFADSLKKRGYSVQRGESFPGFHVSQLSGQFLNYKTRDSVVENYSLMTVY
jgi:hypothetical protein